MDGGIETFLMLRGILITFCNDERIVQITQRNTLLTSS